jgi:hypothetical protein
MAAGDLTKLLDSLSPEDFQATLVDLGVPPPEPAEVADAGAEEPLEEAAPDSAEQGPPSSQSDLGGHVPTAAEMSTGAQACAGDCASYVEQIDALADKASEAGDKAASKKIAKLAGVAEKAQKVADKAAEKAQKAADKEDLGGAAEAAAEAQEACQEAADALDEAKKLMAAVEMPEPEEGAAPAEGAAPPAAAKGAPPAGPKASAKPGPFEAWAQR